MCGTLNFVYFKYRTIHEFKIATKYLFTSVIFIIIWNPLIQVSTNVSIDAKPRNLVPTKLNDFTVYCGRRMWVLQKYVNWSKFARENISVYPSERHSFTNPARSQTPTSFQDPMALCPEQSFNQCLMHLRCTFLWGSYSVLKHKRWFSLRFCREKT